MYPIQRMRINQLVAGALSAAAVFFVAPKSEGMPFGLCGVATSHYKEVVHRAFDYSIKAGDTLSDIARRFIPQPGSATGEGDPTAYVLLARENGVANPDRILAGQTIRIPERRDSLVYKGTFYDFNAPGFCPMADLGSNGTLYQHTKQIDTVYR